MVNVAQGLRAFFTSQIDKARDTSYGSLTPTDDVTPWLWWLFNY